MKRAQYFDLPPKHLLQAYKHDQEVLHMQRVKDFFIFNSKNEGLDFDINTYWVSL